MISRRAMMNDKISEEKGNCILLNKCKGSYLSSLTLYGKSTQESTTGAQLFDEKNVVDGFIASSGILIQPDVNQKEKTSDYIPIPKENKPTSVTATALGTPTSGNYLWIGVSFYGADKAFISRQSNNSWVGAKKYVLKANIPPETEYLRLSYRKYEDVVVMLNFGENEMPYEPYTGGAPSPSPEYPQGIESVGQSGEIGVEVFGGNLLPCDEEETVTLLKEFKFAKPLPAGIYCLSVKSVNGESEADGYQFGMTYEDGTSVYSRILTIGSANLIFPKKQVVLFTLYADKAYPESVGKTTIFTELMLNLGSTALPYEPYKPAQTLIIPTPDGLPGIPVNAGGNYTDENGQQWVADEIDLAKGERVQQTIKVILDGSQKITLQKHLDFNRFAIGENDFPIPSGYAGFCSHFIVNPSPVTMNTIDGAICVYSNGNIYLRSDRFKSADELKSFLKENPVTLEYCLAEPIRTPLPPETIAAQKQLHTYAPTSTIINDAGAGMSVGYRKVRG